MKMSPIKKIVLGLAAITVALSLITANNMASVMLIVASREAGSAAQQSAQTNNAVQNQTNTNDSQSGTVSNDTVVDNSVSDDTASADTATDSATPDAGVDTGADTGADANADAGADANADANANATPDSNAQADDKKPAADDKKPVADNKAPAVDDKKPVADNKAPVADNKAPAADKNTSKKPETKAEIVDYFNKASNKVKTSAKSVTKVKEENYQAQDINLGVLGALQGVVSKLINDNMGVNEEQSGRTGTTAADKNAIYPVENEAWSSKLTVDDVQDATCVEKNGVYTITITVKEDPLATEYAHGTGHHGKAFNIVMPQTIIDNAGAAGSLLKSLKVGYQNGKIIATVDAATGNITSAKYDFVWLMNVDVFGGITAYFGIRTDYSAKW